MVYVCVIVVILMCGFKRFNDSSWVSFVFFGLNVVCAVRVAQFIISPDFFFLLLDKCLLRLLFRFSFHGVFELWLNTIINSLLLYSECLNFYYYYMYYKVIIWEKKQQHFHLNTTSINKMKWPFLFSRCFSVYMRKIYFYCAVNVWQ